MYRDETTETAEVAETPEADVVSEAAPATDLGHLLVSLQLTDSAFPSGFYTLSHGLEGFAQQGAVDHDSLAALLHDVLRHGVGPADATALALAHRAAAADDWDAVVATDRRLHATKLGRETRQAATRTGRQLLDLAAEVFGGPGVVRYHRAVVARRAPGPRPSPRGSCTRRPGCPCGRPSPPTCSRSAPASPERRCGCG